MHIFSNLELKDLNIPFLYLSVLAFSSLNLPGAFLDICKLTTHKNPVLRSYLT